MGVIAEKYAGEILDKYAVQSHVLYGFVADLVKTTLAKRNYQLKEIKLQRSADTEALINIYLFTFRPYSGNFKTQVPMTMYKVEDFDYHKFAGQFCKVWFTITPKQLPNYVIYNFQVLKIELYDFDKFNKAFIDNGFKFNLSNKEPLAQ